MTVIPHTPVFKRFPEVTKKLLLGLKTSYDFFLLLENLFVSLWVWGYGIRACYDTFLRHRYVSIKFANGVIFLRLFIFESCQINFIFFKLWTTNFDKKYRQQASIIDLCLWKISINSVV